MASKGHLDQRVSWSRFAELVNSLLHTNTTTYTQLFRNERLLICRVDLYAQLPHLHHRT